VKIKGDYLPGDTKRIPVEDADKFVADSACIIVVSFIKLQASFIDCRLRSSHITNIPAVLSSKSAAHSNSNASDKDNAETGGRVCLDREQGFISGNLLCLEFMLHPVSALES